VPYVWSQFIQYVDCWSNVTANMGHAVAQQSQVVYPVICCRSCRDMYAIRYRSNSEVTEIDEEAKVNELLSRNED